MDFTNPETFILVILIIFSLFLLIFLYDEYFNKVKGFKLRTIGKELEINFNRREDFKDFKKMNPERYFDEFMTSIRAGNKKIGNFGKVVDKLVNFFDKVADYIKDFELEKNI